MKKKKIYNKTLNCHLSKKVLFFLPKQGTAEHACTE